MPRARSITTLLSAPMWALHVERGMQHLTLMAMEMQRSRAQGGKVVMEDEPEDDRAKNTSYWRDFLKSTGLFPYYVEPDGNIRHSLDPDTREKLKAGSVAVMPVRGTIVYEAWPSEECSLGLCSAQRLSNFLRDCRNDERIAGVVADIYSPGGMVDGMESLGNQMRQLTIEKKTVAHVDCMAASGGYWVASQCGTIVLDGKTSEVGSVGVMLSFFDIIPLWEAIGVKYHELYAPESELKNEAWRMLREKKDPEKYKAELSETAQVFIQTALDGRGDRLKGKDPASIQGRMFAGKKAITAGLADSIGDLESCITIVRAGTRTGGAPPTQDPTSPDPIETQTAVAQVTALHSKKMSLKAKLVALTAAIGLSKEEVNDEVIAAANAELNEKGIDGVTFVSTAEKARLDESAVAIAEAEKMASDAEASKTAAETAKTEAETAKATAQKSLETANKSIQDSTTAIETSAEKHGIEKIDGKSRLELVLAALDSRTEELKTAKQEIAKLKGEPADDGQAAGAVNKAGDVVNHEVPSHEKEFQAFMND